jgi:DNA polymerase elongation subunit (family B)
MLREIPLTDILFLDIETIPAFPNLASAPESEQELWRKKSTTLFRDERLAEDTYERAGIYAEFGRVLCISCGSIRKSPQSETLHLDIRSFAGTAESELLNRFSQHVQKSQARPIRLCAHNGKEFDFPYLSRRMLVNGISLPRMFNNAGKKPWEIPHLDTLDLWKFGDYKHYTSLEVLAHIFGIPSPKSNLDGSKIARAWYVDENLNGIQKYCELDVLTLVKVYLSMSQQLPSEAIQVEYLR